MVEVTPETGVGIFVFRGDVGEDVSICHSVEGELHWVSENDLTKIEMVEDLYYLLPLVRGHHGGEPWIVGKYSYNESNQLSVSFC